MTFLALREKTLVVEDIVTNVGRRDMQVLHTFKESGRREDVSSGGYCN